jgi:NADH:ubiquinone oxidoreductase subunit H
MLGAIRSSLLTLNLEMFMGLLILNITVFSESFSFLPIGVIQESV